MKVIKLLTSIYTWVSLWLVASMLISLGLLFLPYGDGFIKWLNVDPSVEHFYRLAFVVFLSGVLGGGLQGSRGLYYKLKLAEPLTVPFEQKFGIKLWLYSIAFRPIKGGILSVIVLSLLNAGFIGLSNQQAPSMESMYFQISLGFLVGYGAYDVLKKIDQIIKITFSSPRDSNEPEDPYRHSKPS